MILIPSVRRLITANLKIAFPEKTECEIRRIAHENACNTVLTILEFIWFSGRSNILDELMDEKDLCMSARKAVESSGKGIIYVAPHLGNWELAGFQVKHTARVPFAVVVSPQMNPYLDRIIVESREAEGNLVIRDRGAVREMIKALKNGYSLATLVDQNTRVRDGGAFVNFFGLPVCTSKAPAFFARKMNTIVAVGGCVRNGKRYKMFYEELPKQANEYLSDEELLQDIMRINEKFIISYPEQYLWLYRRWLYIPAEADQETSNKFPYYSRRANKKFYNRNS